MKKLTLHRLFSCALTLSTLFIDQHSLANPFIANPSPGGQTFSATLHLPQWMSIDRLTIFIDCGNGMSFFEKKDQRHDITLSYEYFTRHATVSLFYSDAIVPNKETHNIFWLGQEPAEITITSDSSAGDPLSQYRLKNAYARNDIGMDKMEAFAEKEWNELNHFIESYKDKIDSIRSSHMDQLQRKLTGKYLEYIRQNPRSWIALWKFRADIAQGPIGADTLQQFFYTVFPDSLQQTQDGQQALRIINGRLLAHVGQRAPDYTARTLAGDTVSPARNAGKYILLDFWATWCGPCRAEMPAIRELYDKYAGKYFDVISVSVDGKIERRYLDTVMHELRMNWKQVYGYPDIRTNYYIRGIPALFLIDPKGAIIYMDSEDANRNDIGDAGLKRLRAILEEKLHP